MVMEFGSLLSKKIPPLAYVILLWQSVSVAGVNVDEHLAARLIGACLGGAATWFWRNDLVLSRRVACLLFGICGGIGFSPLIGYFFESRYVGAPKIPFAWSFLLALLLVRLFEQMADDPLRLASKLLRFIPRRVTQDRTDDDGNKTA